MKFKINLVEAIFACIVIMQFSVSIWAVCVAPWYGKLYAIIALATLIGIFVAAWRKK